jgi:carbonic anhydrase/acetyltransferase-like protein (isoleucine patch superfamily)
VGHSSNLQDGVTVRTAKTYIGAPRGGHVEIGDRVTVGHAVVLEGGVTLEDEVLVGIGATLQHGARARPWAIGLGLTLP